MEARMVKSIISSVLFTILIVLAGTTNIVVGEEPVYPTGEYWATKFGYVLSGLQIALRNLTGTNYCTLGYFVKDNGWVGLVSAGHCYLNLAPPVDTNIYQPTHNYPSIALVAKAVVDNRSRVDYLIALLCPGVKYATAVINIVNSSTYNILVFQDYYDSETLRSCCLNRTVWITGRTSGTYNGTLVFALRDRIIITTSDLRARLGDSGGPIFIKENDQDATLTGHMIGFVNTEDSIQMIIGNPVDVLIDSGAQICAHGCPP
ncbi:hypothetical protein ACSU1N_01240 [Thermogladius sp. 4427co]|uniref:hypothetical protein n=1 Tax=Thermogladius sp. 4427co TaxID=3450718 RepID=UPI003F79CF39